MHASTCPITVAVCVAVPGCNHVTAVYCMYVPGVSITTLLHHHCKAVTAMDCLYKPLTDRSTLEWCQGRTRAACWCVEACVSMRMSDLHWIQVCILKLLLFFLIAMLFHVTKLLLVAVFELQWFMKEIERLAASCLLADSSVVLADPLFMTICCYVSHGSACTCSHALMASPCFFCGQLAMLTEDYSARCMHSDKIWCVCLCGI